ncbi:hypothetical protein GTU99_31685 [Streptomyces sp. PRKS01-65]|nr:hypothetical protein [Streptomyces harenosi]NEY36656.1 hypothetical protein [Streptomyces harenosi]
MMARQPNPDLTNALAMLHTAVMHTDKNIRDELDKSVKKLESAGRAAHEKTAKEVVDELGRMRTNFRDAYNKLNSSGDSLNNQVTDVVAQLRAELREIRVVLADLTPPVPSPLTSSSSPAPALPEPAGAEGGHPAPAPAATATATATDELAEETAPAAIPAQRAAGQDPYAGPALPADAVRHALHEVLAGELAPVLSALSPTELGAALEETRSGLACLQQHVTELRAAVAELRTRPDATAGTAAAEVSAEHSALLRTAARVSSASLLCHRDIWEFVTAHAGRHPHFRVPPQVADEGDQRIRAALSGRSLIALLIGLYSTQHTAADGDGDRELAATLYERIEESLTHLTPSGEPVTITLDDRAAPAPGTPAADADDGTGSGPAAKTTGASPDATEQDAARDTDPGDESGPSAT